MKELNVVNAMLRVVRNPRINSFDNATDDVLSCRDIYSDVLEEVLKQGWWFNTSKTTFLPTTAMTFLVPADILEFMVDEPFNYIVVRNGRLWDTKNKTYTINMPAITGVAKYLFPIEEIPSAVAIYIKTLCRLRAVDDLDGDPSTHDQEAIYVQDALENANTAQINALSLDNCDIPIVRNILYGV